MFEVEAIVDERRVDSESSCPIYEYMVRWTGCTDVDDQWLSVCDLQSCKEKLDAYLAL